MGPVLPHGENTPSDGVTIKSFPVGLVVKTEFGFIVRSLETRLGR